MKPMNPKSPADLYFGQLRDLYSVESQVILTLPELAAATSPSPLREFLQDQEPLAMRRKRRLQGIFKRHHAPSDGDICEGMKGLIHGGNRHIAMAKNPVVRDLLLIAHCSRIKHYEIAAYQFAATLAGYLDYPKDLETLAEMLGEAKEAEGRLEAFASGMFSCKH